MRSALKRKGGGEKLYFLSLKGVRRQTKLRIPSERGGGKSGVARSIHHERREGKHLVKKGRGNRSGAPIGRKGTSRQNGWG